MRGSKVLIIAYNFPPHGGPGVQRTTKFVKYLREFHWEPTVVTTTADAGSVRDDSLLLDVPADVQVYRVPGFSISRLRRKLSAFRLGKVAVVLNLALRIPDPARFWARKVRATVSSIIETEHPRLIYTTSGPYSSHFVGMWARRQFDLPWFADFRDPWSQNFVTPYLPGYRLLNRYLERRVLATADRVACVSSPWLDELRKNLGKDAGKFVVLPNGYDEEDVQRLPMSVDTKQFTLTHIGSLYRNRHPNALVGAIELLCSEQRIPASELRVLFLGRNIEGKVPDAPPFEMHGYVPHAELHRFREQSNVFLLILDTSHENAGNSSGKIYEYIASNRPVLGIVPPGGVAEQLILDTRTGLAVDSEIPSIANAIEQLYHRWKAGTPDWNPDWSVIRRYTRRNLTAQLAAEFDRLTESGGTA